MKSAKQNAEFNKLWAKGKVDSKYAMDIIRERKKHPIINLAGYYLSKFGFDIGDSVELVIEREQIMIKKAR